MHPECAGSVSRDPGGSTSVRGGVSQQRNVAVICNQHKWWPHTAGPNTSFLSWTRIHPILHPGTNQRLAKPPQERMGTSLLRDAKEGQLQPGNTCQNSNRCLSFRTLTQPWRVRMFSNTGRHIKVSVVPQKNRHHKMAALQITIKKTKK